MIGTIDITVQAAKPDFPLPPIKAFVGSPTSVRLRNVPRRIGEWDITAVTISAAYPDNAVRSAACVLTGGVWVGTITGSASAGISANGFTVTASGTDENGSSVNGYVLGKGDVVVMNADSTITVGDTTYYAHILDSVPTTPHKGDMTVVDGVWKLYDGTQWVALGGSSTVAWDAVTGKPSSYPAIVDDTLSTRGTAADAEAVGEALSQCLAKTGGTLTGGIAIDGPNSETDSLKLGRASSSPGLYTINPYGINQGGETSNPTFPFYGSNRIARLDDTVEAAKSLTAAGQTALFASAVTSTTSTALKDRDCSVVAYSSGMTLTFTASTGLRQFEILITDCTAGGSINFPDVTYRGASDALTLEAGDNHLVFAEYATGCFFVTRALANTITIS